MNQEKLNNISEHLTPTYNRFPIVLDHGEGVYVFDTDGNKYVDFGAGIAVNSLGHNNKELQAVILDQLGKIQHTSNLYFTEPLGEAASTLAEKAGMDKVFFTNSGTEAVECALKLARRHSALHKSDQANELISMNGSFHGRTYGAVSATGQPKYHETFEPILPNIKYAEFNDIDSLEELIGEDTAAVILEPIKGEGGIIPASKEYLQAVRDLCDKTNTLLIFDEVQCGASRSGEFLASQIYDVKPDILCMAKGIGAGFPVGACLATEEVGESLSAGTHGSTYGGNPLAARIVDFVVNTVTEPQFLENVRSTGDHFKNRLEELKHNYPEIIKDVRGEGLILGIELEADVPVGEIVNKSLENGLLIVSAAGNTIRFVPPLIITNDEVDEGLDILESVLAEYK